MDNQRSMALALIVIGLLSINFFYLLDLFFDDEPEIVLGWKSMLAIIGGNLLAIVGIWKLACPSKRDDINADR